MKLFDMLIRQPIYSPEKKRMIESGVRLIRFPVYSSAMCLPVVHYAGMAAGKRGRMVSRYSIIFFLHDRPEDPIIGRFQVDRSDALFADDRKIADALGVPALPIYEVRFVDPSFAGRSYDPAEVMVWGETPDFVTAIAEAVKGGAV